MGTAAMWMALSLPSLVFMVVAAWRDLATRMIPDAVPAALFLTGLVLRGHDSIGAAGVSLVVAVLIFVMLAALHAQGWLGGGDVKLVSGVAAGLAPHAVILFLIATGIAGGVLAAVHLVLRRLPGPTWVPPPTVGLVRVWRAERWRIARRGPLPYGVAIACGGAWAIFHSLGA